MMSKMGKAAQMAAYAYARGQGYPERIIERAWCMHKLDNKNFVEKSWDERLREADDGKSK
jgi:hypothetical protein